jgi:hypothetical protein
LSRDAVRACSIRSRIKPRWRLYSVRMNMLQRLLPLATPCTADGQLLRLQTQVAIGIAAHHICAGGNWSTACHCVMAIQQQRHSTGL